MKLLRTIAALLAGLVGGFTGATSAGAAQGVALADEHALIVHFQYGSTDLGNLFALEDQLIAVVDSGGVGQVDGHEIAVDGSDGYFYIYGPDADRLFEVVRPILANTDKVTEPVVSLRYGRADDPNALQKIANLGAEPDKGPK
jgi:hypothetical protein